MPVAIADILAVLPQTQCSRCGYVDCLAYARAIAGDGVAINQCPPGGAQGIERLAAITGQPVVALNLAFGNESARSLVFIDENWCIGCALCVGACPTDAIVGTNKSMHSIIEAYCTGCELCLPVCPVDCIELIDVTTPLTGWAAWSEEQANQARFRYAIKSDRVNTNTGLDSKTSEEKTGRSQAKSTEHSSTPVPDKKQALIAAALKRARKPER